MAKKAAAKKAAPKKAAAAPKAKKTGGFIAKAPIRRLMKAEGADLVSEDALVFLIDEITKQAQETTKAALKLVKDDKRKKVTAADIRAIYY